jgi:predicted ester cyclase
MSVEQNKAIIRRLYDTQNAVGLKAAWEQMKGYFIPDFIGHTAGSPDVQLGTKDFDKILQDVFQDWSDYHITIEDMVGEGDRVVTRETYRYKQVSTGKVMRGSSISITRFQGGKMAEAWSCEKVWEEAG